MSEVLLAEREGRVLTLTINRPDKLNSLSPEVLLRLGDTLGELAGSDDVRCVVIQGAGEKAFSSGYDIGRIPEEAARTQGTQANPLQYGLDAVAGFAYPVIAMIRGFAMGAGLHLAAVCDLRIAAADAVFSMPPAKLGLVYPVEGYRLFASLVGPAAARAIFLTGRRFTSDEALRMGLVHHVEPSETLEQYARRLATEMAEENAPLAVKGAKFILNRLQAGELSAEDVTRSRRLMAQAFASADAKEARAAFAEKRRPEFTGR
ncbi:MAG TPA: enoyl-CoA hydratase-related protein [Dehalococcoidia bacterium]|nr:enoyl-CoA hydratase-related protein [Dehalococcoidia bacterium]